MARKFIRDHIEAIMIVIFIAIMIRVFVFSTYKIPTESMGPNLIPGDVVIGYRLPYGVRVPISGEKIGKSQIPKRGELIVFSRRDSNLDSQFFLKRVVGVPGDLIEIKASELYLNGIKARKTDFVDKAGAHGSTIHDKAIAKDKAIAHDKAASQSTFQFVTEVLDPQKEITVTLASGNGVADFPKTAIPPGFVFVLSDNRNFGDDSRQFGPISIKDIESSVKLIWLSLSWYTKSFFPGLRWERILNVPR